ncbi:2-oxoacid ferredoxin oxidoreductase [Candidatus Gottesmanbacteria bacterium RIFCSPLOWO2_01_FULL_46_9]|uniref:2-oxoacid ferredoxin oxidoreductase n=1 Tax=Candidatus Gottesmanbacteria bacterium RIFCSPLOWO2_01_FULL_46_9 TaxID=1798394 RepID=A0A1F6AXR8_9BACT|nr:MAG: 2-oxoacid ferredoxin oxidoreductase [Candidatus Gottesmanbacteria bacterium RIFCSPLOWO2_01_FULL_46_9]
MTVNSGVFTANHLPTWCPGCGDYGIWTALKEALAGQGIGTDDGLVVYGVGCHGNMYNWMNIYGFAGLHGRTLPVAQGAKLANHKLPVIVVSGDGDCLGEGGNHFIHAAKRNPDITVILHDNQVYGLTTGQASPTAKPGFVTKSTPEGAFDAPINPLMLAISSGATYVARGFAGDTPGLIQLMSDAVTHKGFSVVDVLQPCVTFDKIHTYQWYRQRIYRLDPASYAPDNKLKALEKAMEWGDKIPVGVFYKEERPTSEDHEPALSGDPLINVPVASECLDDVLSEFI